MNAKVIGALMLLSLGIAASFAATPADNPRESSHTAKPWECAALAHDGAEVVGDEALAAQIMKMGNEGWELVSVSTVVKDGTTTKTIFYFKRPKQGANS